jgi:RNA polymerase sigma-70 factor (ECF subfamily)
MGGEALTLIPITRTILDSKEDKAKIVQIYEEHYGLMMYIAKRILRDYALAEDAAAESLEKLIRIAYKINDISCNETKALIVIIVERTALNILQKLNRIDFDAEEEIDMMIDSSLEVADEIISINGYNDIVAAIEQLSPTLKSVTTLSLVNNVEQKEIAELLGISYGAVRTRLTRAKEILRNRLTRGDEHVKK